MKKAYVVRSGSSITVVQDSSERMLASTGVAMRDLVFEENSFVRFDVTSKQYQFLVGNNHYYVSNDYVQLMN